MKGAREFMQWDPNKSEITDGASKLLAWLAAEDLSQRQFAEISGLHLARINRFLNGKARPTLQEACTIREHVSEIDPADWLDS